MSEPEPSRLNKLLQYRARSLEAAERASRAKDERVRASWDLLAQGYHDMADRLERTVKPQ